MPTVVSPMAVAVAVRGILEIKAISPKISPRGSTSMTTRLPLQLLRNLNGPLFDHIDPVAVRTLLENDLAILKRLV